MRIKSFAKINLGLEILYQRPDGYHELRTLYQSINYCDILDFQILQTPHIQLTGTDPEVPWGPDNLIHRAATLLQKHGAKSKGARIHVQKNIPHGAGLGGGSSNAAMTLWALNELWDLPYRRDELEAMAGGLGADVTFFLNGGLCLGTGIGDQILPLTDLPKRPCLIILPNLNISTAEVYANLADSLTSQDKVSKIIRFLDTRELHELENDLEHTVLRSYPQIKTPISLLLQKGPLLAMLSGSGASVFGLFRDQKEAEWAKKELDRNYQVIIADTLSREEYWHKIRAGV